MRCSDGLAPAPGDYVEVVWANWVAAPFFIRASGNIRVKGARQPTFGSHCLYGYAAMVVGRGVQANLNDDGLGD